MKITQHNRASQGVCTLWARCVNNHRLRLLRLGTTRRFAPLAACGDAPTSREMLLLLNQWTHPASYTVRNYQRDLCNMYVFPIQIAVRGSQPKHKDTR